MEANLYALIDPRNRLVMYIGKTCRTLQYRLTMHLCQGSKAVLAWVAELKTSGLKPEIFLIDKVPLDEWREREIDLIEAFPSLLNKYTGGGGAAFRWALARENNIEHHTNRRDKIRLVSFELWAKALGEEGENIINGQHYDALMKWGSYSDLQ